MFTNCVFNKRCFFEELQNIGDLFRSLFVNFAHEKLDVLSDASANKLLRWIQCWTSFGQKVRWQHVQRTTFQCIGTAICCPGPRHVTCQSEWWVGVTTGKRTQIPVSERERKSAST